MSYESYSNYGQPQQQQFYAQSPDFYSQPSQLAPVGGAIGSSSAHASTAYNPQSDVVTGWWNAFGTGGIEGEQPLLSGQLSAPRAVTRADELAELGINFDHILQKSLTVLNPLSTVEPHIMDDADLAGPLVFCFIFAMLLLLVRHSRLPGEGLTPSSRASPSSRTSTASPCSGPRSSTPS